MTDLSTKMLQDRALRDAAKINVDTDLALLMQNIENKSLSTRIKDRALDSAHKINAEIEQVKDPRTAYIAGGLVGLLTLWLARKPIFRVLGWLFGRSSSKTETDEFSTKDNEEFQSADDEFYHPAYPTCKGGRRGTSGAA